VGEGSPLSLTVSATDVGNDPLSYAYDWENDGSFEANQPDTVSHIFFNQGDFTVRIRVDDGDGGQAFTSTTVSILNEPPIAIANAETNRFEGSPVAFDGTDSSDPGLNDVLTYQWAFGDGAVGSGITSTHTYADNSVYNATLTVTDDSGLSSTASTAVNILNANPTADAGPDLTIDECQQSNNSYNCSFPITFNGAASDPGAADLLTYSWDFGDGSPLADGASATYIYPSLDGPKEYGVTLWVRDDDYNPNPLGGNEIGEAFDSLKLTVNNVSPWNVNAGGPYTGVETLPVNLTGTAEDAPADVPDLTYAWDLDSNPDFETSGSQVPHTWNTAGSYTVRLQVKDNDGGEGFASAQVTIQNALPHAQANGPYTTTLKKPLT
jgi:PKD repeat protein